MIKKRVSNKSQNELFVKSFLSVVAVFLLIFSVEGKKVKKEKYIFAMLKK
ncbi:MAG: hypothetical protein ACOXZH_04370 [Bacteroidales bacterium]|jgi:hypothetical protein